MSIHSAPDKYAATLVQLTNIANAADFIRICDTATNITGIPQGNFNGHPKLQIEYPINSGSITNSELCKIEVEATPVLFGELAKVQAQKIYVVIIMSIRANNPAFTSAEVKILYRGILDKIRINVGNKKGFLLLEAKGFKDQLSVPASLHATNECRWLFGDANCKYDIDFAPVEGTTNNPGSGAINGIVNRLLIAQENRVLQVDNVPTNPALPIAYENGRVSRDGLQITILRWHVDKPSRLEMIRDVPESWIGQQIALIPGCNNRYKTCMMWDNEQHFMGPGIGIPPYNPALQSGL